MKEPPLAPSFQLTEMELEFEAPQVPEVGALGAEPADVVWQSKLSA